MKRNRLIEKTDSDSNIILVEDPDQYDDEGHFRKLRKKVTNFTSKKKRRK